MAAPFRKRPIPASHLQSVAAVTSGVGQAPDAAVPNLGSSQDSFRAISTPARTGWTTGQVIDAPLSRIRSNPFNPRAIYPTSAVDDMAVSLAKHGQRVSATGYLAEDGDIVLIEGETRLRGARAAGLSTLRVELKPKPETDQALYEEARAANVERRDQTPLDDALKWKELLAKKVYPSQIALATALGLKEDHVSRVMSLATLTSRVIDCLSDYPELLNLKMLNAIREYHQVNTSDEDTIELVIEVARAGLGYRDVQARRRAAESGPRRRPRSVQEALAFREGKGVLKSFEQEGRLELSLKGLSPHTLAEITVKLREIMGSRPSPEPHSAGPSASSAP